MIAKNSSSGGISPALKLQISRLKRNQRGFVLVTMAASSIALMGVLGLSVDLGRMFIAKNETQAFCDAAALGAALTLDGTTAGITRAQAVLTGSTNTWNLNSSSVSSPAVAFGTTSAGPWVASPNPATGYMYARVIASAPVQLFFLPVVVSQTTQTVSSSAIAGQVAITSVPRGLAPYTGVAQNSTGPNFGLTVGQSYDIQWPQFNNTRSGCSPTTPDRCFNSPPCAGDTLAIQQLVVTNWGSGNSGYWGASSNSIIQQEILDLIQLQPVAVGTNIFPVLTNGQKQSQAGYLDDRASQDTNHTDNTVPGYMNAIHNGRRLIPMPIVLPQSTTNTTVVGYGQFLLLSNGSPSNYYARTTNGNDPFCALYAGPYTIGSDSTGAGGSTGASRVKLVE
jgi:Flp pilus assembly protein TadG